MTLEEAIRKIEELFHEADEKWRNAISNGSTTGIAHWSGRRMALLDALEFLREVVGEE